MKVIVTVFLISISQLSYALTGLSLIEARNVAIKLAKNDIKLNNVESFNIIPEGNDEVLASFKAGKDIYSYECHYHGKDMECHGEPLSTKSKSKNLKEFEELMKFHKLAMDKLKAYLKRKELDIKILKSIKVWRTSKGPDHDHDHDHEHSEDDHFEGDNFWTKVDIGLKRPVYFECHLELTESEKKPKCHYGKPGKDEEPSF